MTSIERIKATLNHSEPDRVPYDLAGTTVTSMSGLSYARAMSLKGLSPEYDETKTVDIVSQIIIPPENSLQTLKADLRRVGARRIFDLEEKLEKQGDISRFTDQYACDWEMETGKDFYFNQTLHPLEKYEEAGEALENLTIPDLSGRREELYELFDSQLSGSPDHAYVADRNCAGLTEMYLRFRGYEKGYMDMALSPGQTRDFFERIADHKIQYWDIFGDYIIERGLENQFPVLAECDDLGTQQSLLVSEPMLQDLVFPAMSRYLAFVKKKMPWIKVFFHSCGAVRPIIPRFIEMGIDILNPVQYTASDMDLAGLKRDFGKDLCFWGGGIDTQGTLSNGTPQQIKDEVKKNIDILAPGGGYVFVPVHNIQEDVPAENYWAMWEAWDENAAY